MSGDSDEKIDPLSQPTPELLWSSIPGASYIFIRERHFYFSSPIFLFSPLSFFKTGGSTIFIFSIPLFKLWKWGRGYFEVVTGGF